MKKIVVISLTILLLMSALTLPVMAAGSCYMAGPEVIRAGDTITVTFYAGGGIFGGNGTLVYDSSLLTFLSYAPLLGSDVDVTGSEFSFGAEDQSTPISGNVAIFSATFQVGTNVIPGTSVSVTASNVVLTDGENDLPMGSTSWSKTVAEPLSDNANLASLVVSNATINPGFGPGNTEYKASVPFETTNLQVSATAEHPGAKVTVGNTWLAENATTDVQVVVTAETGAQKVYHIRVWRPRDPNYVESDVNTLESLAVEGFMLSPAFTTERRHYAVHLPNEVESVKLTAKLTDGRARVDIPTIENIPVGQTVYEIPVTAENGNVLTYTLTVYRAEPFPDPDAVPEETEPVTEPTTVPTTEPAPTEPEWEWNLENKQLLWALSLVAAFLLGVGITLLATKRKKK